jgi:hypothetical protein
MILIPKTGSYPKLPSMPITIQFIVRSLVGKVMTSADDSASSRHSWLIWQKDFVCIVLAIGIPRDLVGGPFDLWEANVLPQGVDLRHSQSHGKARHRN